MQTVQIFIICLSQHPSILWFLIYYFWKRQLLWFLNDFYSKKNPATRRIFEKSLRGKFKPKKKEKKRSKSTASNFKEKKMLKKQFNGEKKSNKKDLTHKQKFTHKRDSRKQTGKSNKKFKKNKWSVFSLCFVYLSEFKTRTWEWEWLWSLKLLRESFTHLRRFQNMTEMIS